MRSLRSLPLGKDGSGLALWSPPCAQCGAASSLLLPPCRAFSQAAKPPPPACAPPGEAAAMSPRSRHLVERQKELPQSLLARPAANLTRLVPVCGRLALLIAHTSTPPGSRYRRGESTSLKSSPWGHGWRKGACHPPSPKRSLPLSRPAHDPFLSRRPALPRSRRSSPRCDRLCDRQMR